MRGFVMTILSLVLVFSSSAQVTGLFINDNVDLRTWEEHLATPDISFHSALRSYGHAGGFDTSKVKLAKVFRHGVIPLLDLTGSAQVSDSTVYSQRAIMGLGLEERFGKRWSLDLAVLGGFSKQAEFYEPYTEKAEILEGYGQASQNNDLYTFWDINGRLQFQADEHFSFEVGKAKHFLGDGYRSLFLSDHASPYPYLRIDTKVWHLHYMNLFSWQQGMLHPGGGPSAFEDKFTSTHLLSWNISETFNIQLFETIIWQGQDSLSNRNFDVDYLNPIIFYRPVEFASGSADNAIIGLGLSFLAWPKYQLYGQVAFDEFLLSEFRNRTGWWGNKFGVQAGLKGHPFATAPKLFMQAEMNIVRPFTYSHGSPVQSYTHLNQSLAHPQGSNFTEYMVIATQRWKDYEIRGRLAYVMKGFDELGRNLGGDIFRSYEGPFMNFDNVIGQGLRAELWSAELFGSWILDQERDTRIQLGYSLLHQGGELDGQMIHGLQLSVRSSLGDGYR